MREDESAAEVKSEWLMTLNQSQREHEAACETIWCYRVNLTLLGLSASVHVFITSVPCNLGNLNTV